MPRIARRRKTGSRPELSVVQILAWADAYKRRTGHWPQINAGSVREAHAGESWRKVDTALRLGLRGLEGGSSLAQLLTEHRQARNQSRPPPISEEEVLSWADAHQRRTGRWPTSASGPVVDAPGETWRAVDEALRLGLRGLPSGISLAQLLASERGARNHQRLPPLTVRDILQWADEHLRRAGHWPTSSSGPVADSDGETWNGVDTALHLGRRGLPGGSSLSRLLAQQRGARNPKQLPPLSVPQILRWARAHRRRTGRWPTQASGAIPEAPGESWSAIHSALATGCRGLPAGLTLARVIANQGAVPVPSSQPRLTLTQVLAWADAHHESTGSWPHARSGPISGGNGETWRAVDQALHKQQRGLKVGLTLAQLLSERRGVRSRHYAPQLSEKDILRWAEVHHRRTGAWPNFRSGPIPEARGETWRGVDAALQQGSRGLEGDQSLARLLARKLGARNRSNLPPLRPAKIVAWAREHHRRTSSWPKSDSGEVSAAPGETWKGVDLALRWGYRGLPGGLSLAKLLARELGVRNRTSLPVLTPEQILAWAEAHQRRTGEWPHSKTGKVTGNPAETWSGIDQALRAGYRGLPGGSSLADLLQQRR
jgi:hypothetical protein